jgi:hypothetical protein
MFGFPRIAPFFKKFIILRQEKYILSKAMPLNWEDYIHVNMILRG